MPNKPKDDKDTQFNSLEPRTMRGLAFEDVCRDQISKRLENYGSDYTLRTVKQELDLIAGSSEVSRIRFQRSLPNMDECNGDLHLRRDGIVMSRISCKSVMDGTTITLKERHVEQFVHDVDAKSSQRHKAGRFFIFAVVDDRGYPTGDPIMLPGGEVLKLFERHKNEEGKLPFVGLQYFVFSDCSIVGWDAIAGRLCD